MHGKRLFLAVFLLFLAGCAASLSELKRGVGSATFVQLGEEPLVYFLGVTDGKSAWSKGMGAAMFTGTLGALAQASATQYALIASADQVMQGKSPETNAELTGYDPEAAAIVRTLFKNHPWSAKARNHCFQNLRRLGAYRSIPTSCECLERGHRSRTTKVS